MNENNNIDLKLQNAILGIYNLNSIKFMKRFLEGELGILFILFSSQKESLEPTYIANELGISKGRVTILLTSLSEKKYIDIKLDNEDRRKLNISLTKKGKKFINDEVNKAQEYLSLIRKEIGNDKTNELINILNEISNKMKDVNI